MRVRTNLTGRRRALVLAVVATLGALSLSATPAAAAPLDPSGIVSSDGSTVAAVKGFAGTMVRGSAGALARGAVAPDAGAVAAPTDAAGVGPNSIIGPDNRYQVSPGAFPGTATVLITWGSSRCSGWVAGHNGHSTTIVTAGHCVYTPGSGWHSGIYVYPGYNATGLGCAASTLYTVNGWVLGNEEYDYGAIKVYCTYSGQPLAYWTGWYGYLWTAGSLVGNFVRTQGYPGDKPVNTQWASDGYLYAETVRQLFYDNDTVGGQSGSPVYFPNYSTCGHCAVAIHAYGLHGSWPHSSYNHGTRITQEVFNNIQSWVAAA